MEKVKCPICGTLEDYLPYEAECPICGWGCTGTEDVFEEDERDCYNLISRAEAKRLYAKGLNIWGKPIKK